MEHGMSDEATGKSGKMWRYVVTMLVSLPLLYALGVGPAVVLQKRGIISHTTLHYFYDPLSWLVNTTKSGNAFAHYLVYWMDMTNTPH